jgi:hypothetical protein
MHPFISEVVSREWVADRLRQAEAQRIARGVRAQDGRRNRISARRSRLPRRLAEAWARAPN